MKFPSKQVEAAIRDEIAREAKTRPPTKLGVPQPAVDSLVATLAALRVEVEFSVTLPDDVMPAGGFDDVEDCVQSILEQSRRSWSEIHQQQGETVS